MVFLSGSSFRNPLSWWMIVRPGARSQALTHVVAPGSGRPGAPLVH
jgi:hypothetical protein